MSKRKEVMILKRSIVTVNTITIGMKGKKVLSKNGIKSNLVKIDSSKNQLGCQYGLEFDGNDFYNAVSILRENGIQYGVYEEK